MWLLKRKRSPSPASSVKITKETVQSKVTSLLEWRQSLPPSQIQEDDSFYLVLYLTHVPQTESHNIPLPHSLLPKNPKLCLIIDDTPNKSEEHPTSQEAMKKIKSDNIPISKVLDLSEFQNDNTRVCCSYDMFFGEKSVVSQIRNLMGKKMAMELDVMEMDWKTQIEKACSSTLLCLGGGNCHVVEVAKVLMDMDEIVANVIAAIECIVNGLDISWKDMEYIVNVLDNSWKDIEYLQLKMLWSHGLTIYQSIPLSTASDWFEPKTVEQTVKKLVEWRGPKMPDDEQHFFNVVINFFASPIPDGDETHKILLPFSILPHSYKLHKSPPKMCLIVDEGQKRGVSKDDAKKKIKSDDIPFSGVMELSEFILTAFLPSQEEGSQSYDLFFADESVIPRLACQLKDMFVMPFDFMDSDWKGQINKASCSALLCLSTSRYHEVRVANGSMLVDDIVDNVVAAINGIVHVLPGQWENISSLHLKVWESLSLPIYQSKKL